MTEKELTYDDLSISPEDVYAQMGYPVANDKSPEAAGDYKSPQAVIGAAVTREVEAVIGDVRQWLRARFVYITRSDIPSGFHLGNIIARQLRGSEAYALFIATAGAEFENYLRRLKREGDEVRVYIADALGSVIAERCADALECQLQASIDKLSWHHTNRFSPGYCGWGVEEQQVLFPLFVTHTCGVSLTEGSLMVPVKSVSGIIGMGAEVTRKDYVCSLCNYDKCFKQKHKH